MTSEIGIAPGSRSDRLKDVRSIKSSFNHISLLVPKEYRIARYDGRESEVEYREVILTRQPWAAFAPCVWTEDELISGYIPVYKWHVWCDDFKNPQHWWASEATLRRLNDNG